MNEKEENKNPENVPEENLLDVEELLDDLDKKDDEREQKDHVVQEKNDENVSDSGDNLLGDDDFVDQQEEGDYLVVKRREYLREMIICFLISTFFSMISVFIKIFNFFSWSNFFSTVFFTFVGWFVASLLVFLLLSLYFPDVYNLFFDKEKNKNEEKEPIFSDINKKENFSEPTEVKKRQGFSEIDDSYSNSEKETIYSQDKNDLEKKRQNGKIGDFDFSFENKDVARAISSIMGKDD